MYNPTHVITAKCSMSSITETSTINKRGATAAAKQYPIEPAVVCLWVAGIRGREKNRSAKLVAALQVIKDNNGAKTAVSGVFFRHPRHKNAIDIYGCNAGDERIDS